MTLKAKLLAYSILHRCKERGIKASKLAVEDGFTRAYYMFLLKEHNLLERYHAHQESLILVKQEEKVKQRLVVKPKRLRAPLAKKIEALRRAKELVQRCRDMDIPISTLARKDGYQPVNYIGILRRAGIFDAYQEEFGLTQRYASRKLKTIASAQALIDRCLNERKTLYQISRDDGYASTAQQYNLILKAGLRTKYEEAMEKVRLIHLQNELDEIEKKKNAKN